MTRAPELLSGLDEGRTAGVMALASRIQLAPGAVLFRLGAEADVLYLVDRGLITLTMPMQVRGHDEDVLIEERLPGQTLGWSSLIPPHRFTLTAGAPVETELLAFPRDALLGHFASNPDVGYAVLRNVAAVVGQRLQVFQAMWVRQMQHLVNLSHA
jgi:CRP-like cAMP-binding protein